MSTQIPRFNSLMTLMFTFITLLVASTTLSCVKSEPDTTVKTLVCNVNSYTESDPLANSVAYVLADLMNLTPLQQGYNYYTVSPYTTAVAYGHATCSQNLANADCASCLVAARDTLSAYCNDRIGAQVGMVDCSMRYEEYFFT